MKIKELNKTELCTEKCNGVVLRTDNKNSYTKVVVLSNRDKRLLDTLTELKEEICWGNTCQTCALHQTVLCNHGYSNLKKVPKNIAVCEKDEEPPKPAYLVSKHVYRIPKRANRGVERNLFNLANDCLFVLGDCAKCSKRDDCPMVDRDDDDSVAYWDATLRLSNNPLMQAIVQAIKSTCEGRKCEDCPFSDSTYARPCLFTGKPQHWRKEIISNRVISAIERGIRNDAGRKSNN